MRPVLKAIRFILVCWGPVVLLIVVVALIARGVTTQLTIISAGGVRIIVAVIIGFVLGFIAARRRR